MSEALFMFDLTKSMFEQEVLDIIAGIQTFLLLSLLYQAIFFVLSIRIKHTVKLRTMIASAISFNDNSYRKRLICTVVFKKASVG